MYKPWNIVRITYFVDYVRVICRWPTIFYSKKLEQRFYFDTSAISLIKNYLSERLQTVCVDGEFSGFLPLLKGVPAGTIIGPLLFTLFVNDIPECLRYMMYHIFADDFQIYRSFRLCDSIDSLNKINSDLRAIQKWASVNRLNLNVSKTQAIAFSFNIDTRFLPPLWLNGLIVPYSDCVKNLGMLMNKRMDWKDHVGSVCNKVYNGLRSAWPHFNNTPQVTRVLVAKSMFLPHFEYCSVVYSYGIDASSRAMLDRAFGSVIRYAYGIRKYDSIRCYVEKLLGFSLKKFYSYRAFAFLYKLINAKSPKYLNFIVNIGNSSRTKQLRIPRYNHQYGDTLMVKGASEWNRVPMSVRDVSSFGVFRSRCMEHLKD